MRWITRARPKTDRIACPWLLRRFIDQEAEIVFVPPEDVLSRAAADPDARSFDAPGADYTHRGNQCTFEVLIEDFDLGRDPGSKGSPASFMPQMSLRNSELIHLDRDSLRLAREGSRSKVTTSVSWSVAPSSMTPSTSGASNRWRDNDRLCRHQGGTSRIYGSAQSETSPSC